MEYFFHILILIGIYSVLTMSLDLLVGHTGILSISHAAFYSIGAYTSALLTVYGGLSFGSGLLVGMVFAACTSVFISLPSLRLHEDYFVVATLGFQLILFNIVNNWIGLTRGPLGIPGIPQPTVLGLNIDTHIEFFFLVTALTCLVYLIVRQISISPFGRVLRAMREDKIFVQSFGKNTLSFMMIVFAISAALAASAGSIYAHYITYIDPTNFSIMESILIISMVIIGGAGNIRGSILGAAFLVILPEALRFLGMPISVAANMRQVIYGALLILCMLYRPQGFLGKYSFDK